MARSAELHGLAVSLAAPNNQDTEWLFNLESHPSIVQRYRLTGRSLSMSDFAEIVKRSSFAQFIVRRARSGERVGYVHAYDADQVNGTAYVGWISDPKYFRSGFVARGMALFMGYLFDEYGFRKIYGDTVEYNLGSALPHGKLAGLVKVEATLKDDCFAAGRFWDRHIVAMYREDWLPMLERVNTRLNKAAGFIVEANDF